MIGVIWSVITGNPIARLLAKIAGIALAVLTFGYLKKREGAQGAKAKRDRQALDATVKGQEAARKGRAEAVEKLRQGKTPEEIVRSNDSKWN